MHSTANGFHQRLNRLGLLVILLMPLTGCSLRYTARDALEVLQAASQRSRPAPPATRQSDLHRQVGEAARREGLDPAAVAAWRPDPGLEQRVRVEYLPLEARDALTPVSELSRVIPFEVTPEIEAFARRNTRDAYSMSQQLHGLISAIYAVGQFDQQYESGRTRTAAETLASGRGNCFAFTNLFVAAARSIGIQAFYLDATRGNSQLRSDGARIIHSGHIVAGVVTPNGGLVIDFYKMRKDKETFWYRRLNDLEVTALFLNNLGYEAMKNGVDAAPYFRTAVALAPELESPWNNLAVLLMGSGRADEAETILQSAVSSRVVSFAPYFNLGLLYMRQGHYPEAETVFRQAHLRRRDNPFLHYQLCLSYLGQGKREKARKAFEKALRLDQTMLSARTKLDRLAGR